MGKHKKPGVTATTISSKSENKNRAKYVYDLVPVFYILIKRLKHEKKNLHPLCA